MSLNVLGGYEDLTSRANLASNGRFLINQRGTYNPSTWVPITLNAFLVDMWYAYFINIDYAECKARDASVWSGDLLIQGRGKKGQSIIIANIDLSPLGESGKLYGNQVGAMTAAVVAWNTGGVPIVVDVVPIRGASVSTLYLKGANLRSGEVGQAVRAISTDMYNMTSKSYINVTLLADGEFSLGIANFRLLAGAFRNPPVDAPVPIADDLQRCQMYYQQGIFLTQLPINRTVGPNLNRVYCFVPFTTQMSGVPTGTLSLNGADLQHLPTTGAGSAVDTPNWTLNVDTAYNTGLYVRALRADQVVYPILNFNFQWTATV
jgi:hypothetical protein